MRIVLICGFSLVQKAQQAHKVSRLHHTSMNEPVSCCLSSCLCLTSICCEVGLNRFLFLWVLGLFVWCWILRVYPIQPQFSRSICKVHSFCPGERFLICKFCKPIYDFIPVQKEDRKRIIRTQLKSNDQIFDKINTAFFFLNDL